MISNQLGWRGEVGLLALVLIAACHPQARGGGDRGLSDRREVERSARSTGEWSLVRAALGEWRESLPRAPYVAVLQARFESKRGGKVLEGRGMLAVSPHRALRLVVLGPAGVTLLDVWATPQAWRLEIPATERVIRSGAAGGGDRGLPVAMLRWWFLDPLGGRLLSGSVRRGITRVVLKTDSGVVRVAHDPAAPRERWVFERSETGREERMQWNGRELRPAAGGRARYASETSGVRAEIVVERIGAEAPDPEVFVDPDHGGGALDR